jgi:hypothetical protein
MKSGSGTKGTVADPQALEKQLNLSICDVKPS